MRFLTILKTAFTVALLCTPAAAGHAAASSDVAEASLVRLSQQFEMDMSFSSRASDGPHGGTKILTHGPHGGTSAIRTVHRR